VLCLLAFFYGASMGSLDVTMNAHGVAVEAATAARSWPASMPRSRSAGSPAA
jgi:hypothetical protein